MGASDSISIEGSFDTNVLLRYVLQDIESQTEAIDKMLKRGGVYRVSAHAVFEMILVVERTYHFTRLDIAESVQAIIHHDQISCDTDFIDRALSQYIQTDKLSIIDCALLEYARMCPALPFITFDKDIIKQSGGDASAPGV